MKKTNKTATQYGDIVYGIHPVIELIKAKKRKVLTCYTLKTPIKAWKSLQPMLAPYKVTVHHVDREKLNHLAGSTEHQGIVVTAAPFVFKKTFFEPKKHPFIVLLDGVQDVRNAGAIIRSSYCTGVNGIILCKKEGAPMTGATLKASAGLAERMDIYQAPSIASALQDLTKAGYNIYVTALGGKKSATQLTYAKPLCVIIGNEEKGVSKESLQSGTIVTLPQSVPDVSYNASVAAGIILFWISQHQEK
jgi:23S rRNA (guanosine2251-2'-O)-methyltransferase